MDDLLEGYRRFRADTWPAARDRYRSLAEGQRPPTLVIACSDSRVDPATVFGAGPGELFVVRNVAGLAPPYQPDGNYHGTSAALEFGVRVLGVSRIVVLGHALCGGVRAAVEGVPPETPDFLAAWVRIAQPILAGPRPAGTDEEALAHYEEAAIRLSLANLRTFPWIADAEAAGRLALHGFKFDIRSGVLQRLTESGLQPVT